MCREGSTAGKGQGTPGSHSKEDTVPTAVDILQSPSRAEQQKEKGGKEEAGGKLPRRAVCQTPVRMHTSPAHPQGPVTQACPISGSPGLSEAQLRYRHPSKEW